MLTSFPHSCMGEGEQGYKHMTFFLTVLYLVDTSVQYKAPSACVLVLIVENDQHISFKR